MQELINDASIDGWEKGKIVDKGSVEKDMIKCVEVFEGLYK